MEPKKMLILVVLAACLIVPSADLFPKENRGGDRKMTPGSRIGRHGNRENRDGECGKKARKHLRERIRAYAEKHGISIEEAKEKFKEELGKRNRKHKRHEKKEGRRNRWKGDAEWKERARKRMKARIQKYADENGLTFEEALKKLREMRRKKIQAMVKKYAEEHGCTVEEARKAVMKELKKKAQERFGEARGKYQEKRKERRHNRDKDGNGKGKGKGTGEKGPVKQEAGSYETLF